MNIFRLFLLSAILSLGLPSSSSGRDYTPTTTWPYLYRDFQEGYVTTYTGGRIDVSQLNVSLSKGRAHYIRDGVIMEMDMKSVSRVFVGGDEYAPVSGVLLKVLRSGERGLVVSSVTIDIEAMGKADIGYGKSSLASTQNVSLTAITSEMDYSVNRSMEDVRRQKGEDLQLKEVMGIVYNGMFVPATRYDVLNLVGIDKDAVKRFIKENKVRFSNADDLLKLADYLQTL